jgi:hypothetical protein
MFHVERLDGFAAYLPRVLGFCIADQSVHHLIGTEAILDSPLNSSTWNPQPTSSGRTPWFTEPLSSRICEQALGPDLKLALCRLALRAALAQPRIEEKQTFFTKRSNWNVSGFTWVSGQLGACRIRLLVFSLAGCKCSTWNTRLRNCCDRIDEQSIERFSHLTPFLGRHPRRLWPVSHD